MEPASTVYPPHPLVNPAASEPAPGLTPLRDALQVLRSPFLGGVVLAFFIITRLWPAGFDARLYYLRLPPANATTPYWVYLLTVPLSWLGWPLSWQVLVALTLCAAAVFYALRGNRRWWLVVFSSPMLYNAWWGQIELFSILGIAAGLGVLNRKLHPLWMGAAWLLLAIKPQSNYALILLLAFWLWRQRGRRALLPGMALSLGVFGLTLLIWPGWVARLLAVYGGTTFGFANASVWPYGLIAWPLVLLHRPTDGWQRLRMIAAAALLGSPYFTLHHCLTLLLLSDYPAQLALSWLPMVMIFQTEDWSQYAAILPAGILALDFAATYRRRIRR